MFRYKSKTQNLQIGPSTKESHSYGPSMTLMLSLW